MDKNGRYTVDPLAIAKATDPGGGDMDVHCIKKNHPKTTDAEYSPPLGCLMSIHTQKWDGDAGAGSDIHIKSLF